MAFLRIPTPPRLPDPESNGDYSPSARAALLRVLRLYFSQLDAMLQALLGRSGGRFFEQPTASVFAGVDQPIVAATATAVLTPLTTNLQAFTQPTPSQLAAGYDGTFSVRALLSLRNTGGATATVSVWLRKNAIDIPTSRIDVTVPAAGVLPVSVDYIIDLLPTDTFEIRVYTAAAGVSLYAPPAAAPVPRGAAARINVNLISNDSEAMVTSALFRLKKTLIEPPP